MNIEDPIAFAASLAYWHGPVEPVPLAGGLTNRNFTVDDAGERFVVRIGADIPVHQIMRFNELAASRAAHAAGISPEVVHAEPGALVLRFIDGMVLDEATVREPARLARILAVVRRCHQDIPKYLRGPVLMFWVFHVIRDYAATIQAGGGRRAGDLGRLAEAAGTLEAAAGPIEPVFGHNDLLAANFIDDGERVWLIDWDYAGFNSALFDLGGLASNNGLAPAQEDWLLESYFERPLDDALRRRYGAMKCASLLRETLWSMVSELHSTIDFDYAGYTEENLTRFERAWEIFSSG